MKKIIAILLSVVMAAMLSACPGEEQQNSGSEENQEAVSEESRVDKKAANTILENYMRFLMTGNRGAMRSFYSSKLKNKARDKGETAAVSPVGYSIGEGETTKDKATFKINIFNLNRNEQYFSNDEFSYEVKLENRRLVIDSISKEKSTELYKNGDALFKREQDKLTGEKIVSLKELPGFVTARETSEFEQKYKMPDKEFGPCAISPDGKLVVFTTMDKNSFIGTLTEEESSEAFSSMLKAAEGQQKQGGKKGGQQGGQEEQSQGGQEGQGAQQQGKNYKISTVDLLFDCEVRSISFSQDGKLFAVEYMPVTMKGNKKLSGPSSIAVYKSEGGERQTLKSNKQFSSSSYSMTNPYFSAPNELVFRLIPSTKASPEERKSQGYWKLDLEKGKAKHF